MTTDSNEMRSHRAGIAHPPEQLALPLPDTTQTVGGRQATQAITPKGGGYLNTYTAFKLRTGAIKKIGRDPRLDELQALGLHATWQKVAAEIGVDAFLAMWRIVDQEQQWHHPKGTLEIPLRHYSSYLRFQRNQFIRALSMAGMTEKEIHYRLLTALGEKLDPTHIKRIAKNQ